MDDDPLLGEHLCARCGDPYEWFPGAWERCPDCRQAEQDWQYLKSTFRALGEWIFVPEMDDAL